MKANPDQPTDSGLLTPVSGLPTSITKKFLNPNKY